MTAYQTFSKLCAGHNVTASQVAREANINRSTLTQWKTGRSKPKIDKLCKIANYFKVPVTMLIEDYDGEN